MKIVLFLLSALGSFANAYEMTCSRQGAFHSVVITEDSATISGNSKSMVVYFRGVHSNGKKIFSSENKTVFVLLNPNGTADVLDGSTGQVSADLPCELPYQCKRPEAGC